MGSSRSFPPDGKGKGKGKAGKGREGKGKQGGKTTRLQAFPNAAQMPLRTPAVQVVPARFLQVRRCLAEDQEAWLATSPRHVREVYKQGSPYYVFQLLAFAHILKLLGLRVVGSCSTWQRLVAKVRRQVQQPSADRLQPSCRRARGDDAPGGPEGSDQGSWDRTHYSGSKHSPSCAKSTPPERSR